MTSSPTTKPGTCKAQHKLGASLAGIELTGTKASLWYWFTAPKECIFTPSNVGNLALHTRTGTQGFENVRCALYRGSPRNAVLHACGSSRMTKSLRPHLANEDLLHAHRSFKSTSTQRNTTRLQSDTAASSASSGVSSKTVARFGITSASTHAQASWRSTGSNSTLHTSPAKNIQTDSRSSNASFFSSSRNTTNARSAYVVQALASFRAFDRSGLTLRPPSLLCQGEEVFSSLQRSSCTLMWLKAKAMCTGNGRPCSATETTPQMEPPQLPASKHTGLPKKLR
eukprot:6477473-Amphidinium_carterae.1